MIEFFESIPIVFKIIYAIFCFTLICFIPVLLFINKLTETIKNLPDKERMRYRNSSMKLLKIDKIMFWTSPLNLIIVPYILFINFPDEFIYMTICMVLVYLLLLMNYFIWKMILLKT